MLVLYFNTKSWELWMARDGQSLLTRISIWSFLAVYTLRETGKSTLSLMFPADPRIPAYNGLAAAAVSPPEPPVVETDFYTWSVSQTYNWILL